MSMAYLDPKSHFSIKNRLRSWFENGEIENRPAPENVPSWQQQIFADVGDFLFDSQLDPTPNNYDLAYQFRSAHNANLVIAIRSEIERSGALDADAAERIFAQSGGPVSVEALASFTERIETQASGLSTIARQSAGDAKDFSSALERECASGHEVTAIIDLAHAMVARTRLAESQLRHTQKQLSGLRSNLVAAQRAADVDPLTELPNRRAFKRDLEMLIDTARRDAKHFRSVFATSIISNASTTATGMRLATACCVTSRRRWHALSTRGGSSGGSAARSLWLRCPIWIWPRHALQSMPPGTNWASVICLRQLTIPTSVRLLFQRV